MKIRILASGEVRHIDNSTGAALVSAGLAETLSMLPKPGDYIVPEPTWEVVTAGVERRELVIRMTLPNQVLHYSGNPDTIHNRKDWSGREFCSAFGRPVPPEIVKQYTRSWKQFPDLRGPQGTGIPGSKECPENELMNADLENRRANGQGR